MACSGYFIFERGFLFLPGCSNGCSNPWLFRRSCNPPWIQNAAGTRNTCPEFLEIWGAKDVSSIRQKRTLEGLEISSVRKHRGLWPIVSKSQCGSIFFTRRESSLKEEAQKMKDMIFARASNFRGICQVWSLVSSSDPAVVRGNAALCVIMA